MTLPIRNNLRYRKGLLMATASSLRVRLPLRRLIGFEARWFFLPLVVFLAIHFILRLLLADNLEPDDADLALFSQSLAWGYSDQGPLYSWLLQPLFAVFGVGVVALTILRVVILGAIFWLIYRITLDLTDNQRLAIMVSFAPFLVPTFIWHAVAYLTHTNLLCLIALATFHRLQRLREQGRTGDYILLGVILALGGLTKYNYAIFAITLWGAGLMVASYRRRLLDGRMLLTGGIAVLMVLPHCLWLMNHWAHISTLLASKTGVSQAPSAGGGFWPVHASLIGIGQLIQNVILIPGLLVLVFLWLFPWRRASIAKEQPSSRANEACRLLEWFGLFVFTWFLAQAIIAGAKVHERWLQPFFILLPVYLFVRLDGVELSPLSVRRYASTLAWAAFAVTVARTTMIFVGGARTGIYPLQMDFTSAEQTLKHNVEGMEVIIAEDRVIAGNLAHRFPDVTCWCAGRPAYEPSRELDQPQRGILVWNRVHGDTLSPYLQLYLAQYGFHFTLLSEVHFLDIPPSLEGKRHNRLAYVVADITKTENGSSLTRVPRTASIDP